MAQEKTITTDIKHEIENRVEKFNQKHLAKSNCKYYADIKGEFIYLMRRSIHVPKERICRLSYNNDLNNMDFAIYRYSTETYDPTEIFFPGAEYVDGTLEGAMQACLEAYPV